MAYLWRGTIRIPTIHVVVFPARQQQIGVPGTPGNGHHTFPVLFQYLQPGTFSSDFDTKKRTKYENGKTYGVRNGT